MFKFKSSLSIVLSVIIIISLFAGCSSQKAEERGTASSTTVMTTVSATDENTTEKENKIEAKQTSSTTVKTTKQWSTTEKSKEKENEKGKEKTTEKSTGSAKTTQKKKASTTAASTTKKTESTVSTCTLTINCTAVLDNMSSLKAGHEKYIPDDGYILSNKKITFSKGDTVYDVLKEACSENGIRLTASSSSFGIYVSGINNIDEKDCGNKSGWTYLVNGKMPMVTCGKYTVNSGDEIEFSYVV